MRVAVTHQRLVSASDLKRQRGWTDGLLAALLGAPDALSPNPHGFRSPMRWFREDRVLDAESAPSFERRLQRLTPSVAWRRGQPTRVWASGELEHLEWLEDPRRIALFHAPRRPRARRRRRGADEAAAPAAAAAPEPWYEVLTLF